MASMPAAANILINPGFELPFDTPYSSNGWRVISEEAFGDCGEAHSGSCSLAAASDPLNRVADLTYQFFDTVAGQQYALSFFYKTSRQVLNQFPNASISGTVTVISGAVGSYQTVAAATFAGGATWARYDGTFTATGASSRVAFKGLGFSDNHHGNDVNIDDVSITAVPEPQTWLLMLGGLGTLGWCSRRRRIDPRAAP
jgi:hypothetical protein